MSITSQIRLFANLESLQELLPAWENLLAESPSATIFSTWEWLAPWWRAFGRGQQLVTVAVFDSSWRLCGLAPLSLTNRRLSTGRSVGVLRLMGDGSGDSDNLDLPVRRGFEEEFAALLVDSLQTHVKGWDICQFNTLPSHSPLGQCLRRQLQQRRWTQFVYPRPWCVVRLPETWDSYAEQLSSEDRKNLERYQRRLERRYKVRFYKCTEEKDLPACLEALFRLHQQRWQLRGEPGSFSDPLRQQFYHEMSRMFLRRGWLELWLLELDGQMAAVQFAFRYRDTVFQLQEGFDSERASDRVGFLLRGHVLKQLISQGVRQYDFLAGEPGYKARWAAEEGTYSNFHFARPWSAGSVYLRLVHNQREGKEWLRAHLPQSAWNLMHHVKVRLRGNREEAAEQTAARLSQ